MKTDKSLSNACEKAYQKGGQIAVFDLVSKLSPRKSKALKLDYERCNACECKSPAQNHVCLVCGQETIKNPSKKEELL